MPQYAAALDLSTLNGVEGFRVDGVDPNDRAGFSVASAGDVNGDGFDDFLIGAFAADPGGDSEAGETYLVFGAAGGWNASLDLSTLDGTNGFRLDGIDAVDRSANSVAGAGDVNGDGFADLIIGAYFGDRTGDDNAGEAYVVFGRASGWSASLDLSTLNGTTGFRVLGADPNDFAGFSVAGAGDVNGDGFDDVIIGARGGDPGGRDGAGEAYVVFGRASGWSSTFDVSTISGANGFRLDGIDAGDQFGYVVAGAGDVNGDGLADLIVGAQTGDPGGRSDAGETYIVFGRTSGWGAAEAMSALDGTNGFRLDGVDQLDNAGFSVASAGDINADGFDDLIIGALFADPGGDSNAGETYVVFGRASGWSASLALSALNGTNGFRIDGIDASDVSGFSVASAGDFNGDGFDDVIIGAFLADPGGDSDAGESYVVFGRASGWGASFDLSTLNGNNGFRLDGIDPDDQSGVSVTAAGDINGDGFDDIIVGAPNGDPGGDANAGEAYVIFGAAPGEAVVRTGTNLANTIYGSDQSDFLFGLGGNDTLIGAGGNDNMDGGSGVDTAVFIATSTAATITRDLAGYWTVDNGYSGVDLLVGMEFVQFADRTFALRPVEGSNDGNGTADILFRNPSGQVQLWNLNGTAITNGAVIGGSDINFTAIGQGDFNGDGRYDVLWRNAAGTLAQWQIDNQTILGTRAYSADVSWSVAGVGDFNGDYRDDILWRNNDGVLAQWQMNGLDVTAVAAFAVSDPTWAIATIADFNADGRDEILWRNSSGVLAQWSMNGFAATNLGAFAVSDTDWAIIGTGDFNGDLREDILWRNSGGITAVWMMDGTTALSTGTLSLDADPTWTFSDVGDYNGDGRDDILWRQTDGTFSLWTLNGFQATAAGNIGNPGADWTYIG